MDKEELKQLIKEEITSTRLSSLIVQAIEQVDPDLSYRELASAVAGVLESEYSSHNFGPFIDELKNLLKIEKEIGEDLEEIKTNKPKSVGFHEFLKTYTNYLKNLPRDEMFDENGNYNSQLKQYHDIIKQYAQQGTEEEKMRAKFVLSFIP